jgi:hypothetical protein
MDLTNHYSRTLPARRFSNVTVNALSLTLDRQLCHSPAQFGTLRALHRQAQPNLSVSLLTHGREPCLVQLRTDGIWHVPWCRHLLVCLHRITRAKLLIGAREVTRHAPLQHYVSPFPDYQRLGAALDWPGIEALLLPSHPQINSGKRFRGTARRTTALYAGLCVRILGGQPECAAQHHVRSTAAASAGRGINSALCGAMPSCGVQCVGPLWFKATADRYPVQSYLPSVWRSAATSMSILSGSGGDAGPLHHHRPPLSRSPHGGTPRAPSARKARSLPSASPHSGHCLRKPPRGARG